MNLECKSNFSFLGYAEIAVPGGSVAGWPESDNMANLVQLNLTGTKLGNFMQRTENRNLYSGLIRCNKDELKSTHPLPACDRVKPIFNFFLH